MPSILFNKKIVSGILVNLILLLTNSPFVLSQQSKAQKLFYFEYRVTFPNSYAHVLHITNPFPKHKIVLTAIKVRQAKLWLLKSENKPEIEGTITWSYDDKKGLLILQSPGQGFTDVIEIKFAINLAAGEEISSLECKAYHIARPPKWIYPSSTKLTSELIE